MSCGNAMASREAERAHRLDGDLPGEAQLLGRDRRRVDVDPADAEADSGRAEAVAQRDQRGLADARDHDAVQLDAVDELLEERLVGRRLGDRLVEVALELIARLDAKDGALAARVDGLQDRREGDLLERGVDIRRRAEARVRRLRKSGCTERVTHRALVRQEVGRLRPDAGKAELLGDCGHDGHGAIGGDREHAVDADPAARPPPRRRHR